MKRVCIESPYWHDDPRQRNIHLTYLAHCLRDSYERGEAPYAGHALGPLALDEGGGRERGLAVDHEYLNVCHVVAFYLDFGWSPGMRKALEVTKARRLWTTPPRIEERYLGRSVADLARLLVGPTGATLVARAILTEGREIEVRPGAHDPA